MNVYSANAEHAHKIGSKTVRACEETTNENYKILGFVERDCEHVGYPNASLEIHNGPTSVMEYMPMNAEVHYPGKRRRRLLHKENLNH